MRKLIVNFEFPLNADGKEPSYLYLGGKDLHDLAQHVEVSLVCDFIQRMTDFERLVIGRLDAERNKELSNFLNMRGLKHSLFEGSISSLPWTKQIMKSIRQDYSQPWIFFEDVQMGLLKDILNEFWSCYGGYWLFLYPGVLFDSKTWKQAKEKMQYDIWEFVRTHSTNFEVSILISDDHAIEVFSNKISPAKLFNAVVETASAYNMALSTGQNP